MSSSYWVLIFPFTLCTLVLLELSLISSPSPLCVVTPPLKYPSTGLSFQHGEVRCGGVTKRGRRREERNPFLQPLQPEARRQYQRAYLR
ncbi:hypothetical protein F5H01DRAFT_359042 [Linnemannia elongata]|nr:hypothetical protein F5H01DRAFT_359042 [Linnemannia elongata]